MQPLSGCAEERVLQERYQAALRSYWEGLTALEAVSNYKDFIEAYERAEGVRLLFARAKLELENHTREHGCSMLIDEEAVELFTNSGLAAET
jgi:hypothetical protein